MCRAYLQSVPGVWTGQYNQDINWDAVKTVICSSCPALGPSRLSAQPIMGAVNVMGGHVGRGGGLFCCPEFTGCSLSSNPRVTFGKQKHSNRINQRNHKRNVGPNSTQTAGRPQ